MNKIIVIGSSCKDNQKTLEFIKKHEQQSGEGCRLVFIEDENKTMREITDQVKFQLGVVKLDKEVRDNTLFILGHDPIVEKPFSTNENFVLEKREIKMVDDEPAPPLLPRDKRYNKRRNTFQIKPSSRGYVLSGGIDKATGEKRLDLPEFKDSKGQKYIRKPNGTISKVDKFPSEILKEQFNGKDKEKFLAEHNNVPQVIIKD